MYIIKTPLNKALINKINYFQDVTGISSVISQK